MKHPYIINNVYDDQLIAVTYIMTHTPIEIKSGAWSQKGPRRSEEERNLQLKEQED